MLSRAFERTEISAQNMANITTPGYKALSSFPFEESGLETGVPGESSGRNTAIDFSSGQLQKTGNPFDLALSGTGFFVVRSDTQTFYTRDGQFVRGNGGRIETSDGLSLQSESGGDIVVPQNNPQILSDGTVLANGQPVARIATVDFADRGTLEQAGAGRFTTTSQTEDADVQIHQGMLESSNVSTAGEMISIMSALRSAESGQKIVQVYDDLMARALSAFGQT